MGYFKKPTLETKRVQLNEQYWVDITIETTWKQKKHFLLAAGTKLGANGAVATPLDAYLLGIIVAWNLDDEKGNIMPINQESLDLIDPDDMQKIIDVAGAAVIEEQRANDEEVKKNSSSQSPDILAETETPNTSP